MNKGQLYEKAILAGGCFWGMRDLFIFSRRYLDLVSVAGGEVANATYRNHEGMRKPSKSSLAPISRSRQSPNFLPDSDQRRPTVK
jgi:hypothetical protein